MSNLSPVISAALNRGWSWKPPPNFTVSQWANTERRLSAESAAEPGRYSTLKAPYQSGMMDALNEPGVHTVVLMTSAQVGKTVLIENVIGYHIHHDPSPILMVMPTVEMAETFSRDRLAPMVRDTPALQGRIADPKSKSAGNTLLYKWFPGGFIVMTGANSPSSLASRPIRIVLCDEVDRYPVSAGTEGDPVALAVKRTATFWNRRIVMTSTPTIKGNSRIEMAFNDSDQRRYYVPCPHCGEMQFLEWKNIQWLPGNPSSAGYVCRSCAALINESSKQSMLQQGQWIAELPCNGIAGFHINELYSPWRRWSDIVKDFLFAKQSPETLKVWVNVSLGETWEESSEKSDPATLLSRRENYTSARLPAGILYLTCGVDCQDDRLELEIVGWRQTSRDEPPESWGVEYHVLRGDPARTAVWEQLDGILKGEWRTEEGRALRISAACVDSGGHHTAQVYAFCSERKGRHIYATKGMAGPRPVWSHKAGKSQKYKAQVWHIGVDTGKDAWYARLRIADFGPGYCHFPIAYNEDYFDMLTSEQVRTKYSKGHPVREWFCPQGRRNEALDIRVMNLAALLSRPVNWPALAAQPVTPISKPAPKAQPNSFINRPSGSPWIRR